MTEKPKPTKKPTHGMSIDVYDITITVLYVLLVAAATYAVLVAIFP